MKAIIAVATFLAAALCAGAQNADEQKLKLEMEHALLNAKILNVEGGVMGPPVKGAPYTATEVTESTQTLGDGTRIHNEHQTTTCRDGMGRIRRESGEEIVIMDPVSNVRYSLHPSDHTAIKMPMAVTTENAAGLQRHIVIAGRGGPLPGPEVMMAAPIAAGAVVGPDAVITQTFVNDGVTIGYKAVARGGKVEDLGTQSMEGILAQGTRTTRTIETGAIGNDRPINMVSERWFSPDLQTVVMSKQTDPREGETVFKLTNVLRGEPDPSLFQLPAGYQVNEPATMTIRHE